MLTFIKEDTYVKKLLACMLCMTMLSAVPVYAEEDSAVSEAIETNSTADSAAAEETEIDEAEADEAAPGVIEIATAEELAAVNEDLTADYVLTADIDLRGEEWTPLGAFAPSGETEEEQETPDPAVAFTGTFDGNGHTISNLTISQPVPWDIPTAPMSMT